MHNVNYRLKDKKQLIVLHNEIQRRTLQVQFGQDNTKLKAECNELSMQIAAINSKYRAGAQA